MFLIFGIKRGEYFGNIFGVFRDVWVYYSSKVKLDFSLDGRGERGEVWNYKVIFQY